MAWKAVENPAVRSSGVLAWQPSCEGHHRSWFYPGMNRCHCQSPPAWADGGSWRSGSPAAGLPRPGMPDGVLDLLRTAIADSAIAARLAARKPGAGNTVPPTAATSGVWKAGSIIATGSVRTGGVTCRLRVTDQGSLSVISPAPFGCGETITTPAAVALRVRLPGRLEKRARSLAALLDLWPARPLRRSFPTDSTTKVSLR